MNVIKLNNIVIDDDDDDDDNNNNNNNNNNNKVYVIFDLCKTRICVSRKKQIQNYNENKIFNIINKQIIKEIEYLFILFIYLNKKVSKNKQIVRKPKEK